MKLFYRTVLVLFWAVFIPSALAGGGHDHGDEHGHAHDHDTDKAELAKGPHGGRLLELADFALEIAIFEDQVPPQYRIYAYHDQQPIDPKLVTAKVTLERFLRAPEKFEFTARDNYLTADRVVEEPHSFVVKVEANYSGQHYDWEYTSYEGRAEFSERELAAAKLSIDQAQSEKINTTTEVFGRLLPNEDRVAHIMPRFPGVIKEIRKRLGDTVEKDEVLALVESNQSLQVYEIRSLIKGQVVKRHATLGEFVSEGKELFVIADLSEIWADFQVYRDDFSTIEPGQQISIHAGEDLPPINARVSYVSPFTDVATQSKLIRAVIDNHDRLLRPGLFISGTLSSDLKDVPVAVKREALQKFRDWDVVFLTDGEVFQAMPVKTGRKDLQFVEILAGLNARDRYVSTNSFIVKAEIEKSQASHDH
ncbi:efflux RND transporter periplasmic adaptor subunit [bacterium]|nr:efflux RND transporter periplasmic adaptor subunit [bacterium]